MNPSLSEISKALLALSEELDDLDRKDAELLEKRKLIARKQRVCQEAIDIILTASSSGSLYGKK